MSVDGEVKIKEEVNSEDEDQELPAIVDMEKMIKVEINEDVIASNEEGVDPLEDMDNQDIDTSKFLEVQYTPPTSSSPKIDFSKKVIRYESKGNGPKKAQAQKLLEEKLKATLLEQKRLQLEIAALKHSGDDPDRTVRLKMRKGIHDVNDTHRVREVDGREKKLIERRKIKVDLERERRRELTEHYDNLYYWVNLGKTENLDYKQSYNERMTSAIDCIQELEKTIIEQESEYEKLFHINNQLSIKLMNLSPDTPFNKKNQFLYPCEFPHCSKMFKSIKQAFIHHQVSHVDKGLIPSYMKLKVDTGKHLSEKHLAKEMAANERKVFAATEKKVLSNVFLKCRHCSTITNDKTVLHLHSLLHKQLTYFKCPHELCSKLFGVPSKLKTHYFLVHEAVLSSEDQYVMSQEARVDLNNTIIAYLSFTGKLEKDKECLADIDNFLEASLDAALIKDEMDIQQEIDSISEDELETMFQEEIQSMAIDEFSIVEAEEKDPLSILS